MNRIVLEFVPRDADETQHLTEHLMTLQEVDSVSVDHGGDDRFAAEAALVIVVLGSAGLAALTRLADWLRDRRDCLLVVDARGVDLHVEERCDIAGRRGQVIIVTSAAEQVVIQRNDAVLDLQAIVTNAIDHSTEAAAALARSAGASAQIERPRTNL